MKNIKQILGANVCRFRERMGMTQQTLADHLTVSKATISSIERGAKWPKYSTVKAICLVLEVEEYQLFESETRSKPSPIEALEVLQDVVKEWMLS